MGFFSAHRKNGRLSGKASAGNRRLRWAALTVSVALLSACSSTGESFKASGLNQIVTGRTTMEQASGYLGAQPVDVWRQGDTTLARWAYKGTVATDAVYFRQEAWLRFGPDGTFQRMENSINLPPAQHPRTAEEADRETRAEQERIAREAPPQTVVVQSAEATDATPVAVPAADAIQPASLTIPPDAKPSSARSVQPTQSAKSARPGQSAQASTKAGRSTPAKKPTTAAQGAASAVNPLLPDGTTVIPGVTYPVQKDGR